MTIVVALNDAKNNRLIIGSDSISHGDLNVEFETPKFYRLSTHSNIIVGFCGSWRIGQVLSNWSPPEKLEKENDDSYLFKTLCSSIELYLIEMNAVLVGNGNSLPDDGNSLPDGCMLILCYKNNICLIDSSLSFLKGVSDHECIGCGETFARASLFSTRNLEIDPYLRVQIALNAACKFSPGCGGEIKIKEFKFEE